MVIINVPMSVGRIKNLCVGGGRGPFIVRHVIARRAIGAFSNLLRRFPMLVFLRFQFNFDVIAFFGKRWKAGHRAVRQWFGLFFFYGARLGQLLWQCWQVLASVEGINAEGLIFTSRGCSKQVTYAARSVGLRRSHDNWDNQTGRGEFDLKFWRRENLSEKKFWCCVYRELCGN